MQQGHAIPLEPYQTQTPPVTEQYKLDRAWKYEGYGSFSRWMASDDDFFVFRRFDTLNARTILWIQDRITRKEERLRMIQKGIEDAPEALGYRNDSFRYDIVACKERDVLMGELSHLLHQYSQHYPDLRLSQLMFVDTYVQAYSEVRSRPRAEDRQVSNVRNRLQRGAVAKEEATFIDERGDLITIGHRDRPPLARLLEFCLRQAACFRAKPILGLHVLGPATTYTDDERFEIVTNVCIVFVGLLMLLVPPWWLLKINSDYVRLGVITGFVFIFILLMSLSVVNRPFEVVAYTAAYAAVLMVFMQVSPAGTS